MPRSRVSPPIAAFQAPESAASPYKLANPNAKLKDWFRIENAAAGSDTTHVYIYDMIGGWFGVNAQDFIDEIKVIKTGAITLHINSPGGSVFDGVAIYNALRSHAAEVNVEVDALAASAASFIAQAGDTVTMNQGSMMMIHDASAGSYEDAAGHRVTAEILDKISNSIANIYAKRAGGTMETWRETMKAEAWYSAQEAVDAGLADSVGEGSASSDPADKWDLSIFNYAGRAHAPSPLEVMNRATKEASVTAQTAKNGGDEKKEEEQTGAPAGSPELPAEEAPAQGGQAPAEQQSENQPSGEPENKAGALSFVMNGQKVTDPRAVQAHIESLEAFKRDTGVANRRDFVKNLARSNKISAAQIDSLTAYALGLPTDEAFASWTGTWDAAPSNPAFAQHVASGSSNHAGDDGQQTALEQELATAEGIVDSLKKSGMSQEKIELTPSWQKLKTHNRI
jgi:ATP-dependent protease ClpP protease subunit